MITTAHRFDNDAEHIVKGSASPRRRFLLLVAVAVAVALSPAFFVNIVFVGINWLGSGAGNGLACPSSVLPPVGDGQINLLAGKFPPASTLGSKNRTLAKMASRAANSVVRRLAHRNIDWCVSLVAGFCQKKCGDRSEGWSNYPPWKCNLQWQIRW